MRSFTFQLLSAALLAMGASLTVQAATFCATTSAELQTDLATAAGNNQDNTINVYFGTYAVPAGGFAYFSTSNHSLDLEGGWFSHGSGNCDFQDFAGNNTVLDGQHTDPVMSIQTGNNTTGNITLRYFTFQNGLGSPSSLDLEATTSTGSIRVENSLFRSNNQTHAMFTDSGVVSIVSDYGPVYVLDNAILDNVCSADGALYIATSDTTDTYAVYVNNNTIAGNTVTSGAVIGFFPFGQGTFTVSNNIVWDGSAHDLQNYSGNAPNMIFANNDVDGFYVAPSPSTGDINKDPKFIDPLNGNYRLMGNSPARDVGENSPPGTTRNVDLDGNPRVVFGTVDMGAYEIQDEIFVDGFGG